LPVAESAPARRAERDLRIARVYLDEGKPEQALVFLERDVQDAAREAEVATLKVTALLQLQRVDDAAALLDAMPKTLQGTPPCALLRARVLVAQNRWESARRLAEEALAREPGLLEAHRVLGRIYEHQQDWPKAAEHYRALSEAQTQPAN
jgi:tetratricopeptide (TPR) repeat protein